MNGDRLPDVHEDEHEHHCVYRQKLKQYAAFFPDIPAPVRRGMHLVASLEPRDLVGLHRPARELILEEFENWVEERPIVWPVGAVPIGADKKP